MKKKLAALLLGLTVAAVSVGCGKAAAENNEETPVVSENTTGGDTVISWEDLSGQQGEEEEDSVNSLDVAPEGMYMNELTGDWISEDLKNQRPIAVMVDNELTALNHFGTSQADIVYEMMNSTANGRITRLMCIFKDYNAVSQIGSIRSIRTTNLQLMPEYDAIAIHDGGPFYINNFLANPFQDHLSSGFARIKNGKPSEYTEYVTTGEINDRCKAAGIDQNYRDQWYQGQHFQFAKHSEKVDLSKESNAKEVTFIDIPYEHNKMELTYIPETQTYRYAEYNQEYIDELTGDHLEFTNVILQESTFFEWDEHGYLHFNVHNGDGMHGWYITNGYAVPITWAKGPQEFDITHFFLEDGTEITLNIGKTYVCIIPDDSWSKLVIE
ncbi:MAG: DUF3048 domain-containing protein [Lachnospiraceae bacterium]|nr:DUF3048 domain-containing protein [Lachnospiraceae bacterium]